MPDPLRHLGAGLSLAMLLFVSTSCQEEEEAFVPDVTRFDFPLDRNAEYVIVLGDIQEYSYCNQYAHTYLSSTMSWIAGMQHQGYKVDCILQVGDITVINQLWEYNSFARFAQCIASNTQWIGVTGNHDYDWDDYSIIHDRSTTHFTRYMAYDPLLHSIVASYEPAVLDNIIVSTQLCGQPYKVIALEFAPRQQAVEWARQYVQAHPDDRFILLTHEFLETDGQRLDRTQSYASRQFADTQNCSPQEVWERLVYDHDNIRCVVCGHNGFSVQRADANAQGRMVPQLLFNLQYLPNGGDGYLQLWELHPGSNEVSVRTIRSIDNTLYPDSLAPVFDHQTTQFTFTL